MPTKMACIEDRFHAAVNVIKGLPKNGPYQPSTAMMLKFYGLYKQATEGACEHKKPGFWDIVGKAKWDAWMSNKHLSKEQAMQRYVESLQEIIETMSFTENVQNFVGSLSGLENINLDELELISPGMRELAESHPNSPFHSRTNSPQHGGSANSSSNIENEKLVQQSQLDHEHFTNGYNVTPVPTPTRISIDAATAQQTAANVEPSDDEYDDPYDINQDLTISLTQNSQLLQQIQTTITRMNADMNAVSQRLCNIEKVLDEQRKSQIQQSRSKMFTGRGTQHWPTWWPFEDISPTWFVVLVIWPLVVRRIAHLLNKSRKR